MKELLNLGRNASECCTLNFVTREGTAFIMDNHLAALWCWIQVIDTGKKYNLFHIDRHYDLSLGRESYIVKSLKKQKTIIKEIPVERLTAYEYFADEMTRQTFRWDNYFGILTKLYPDLLETVYFATHEQGDKKWRLRFTEKDIWDLPENLNYWIDDDSKRTGLKWIVNVDIDYFFIANPYSEEGGEFTGTEYQFLADTYVRQIAEEIRRSFHNIEVLTIALSPECCGGWDNAVKVAKIFTNQVGLSFPSI